MTGVWISIWKRFDLKVLKIFVNVEPSVLIQFENIKNRGKFKNLESLIDSRYPMNKNISQKILNIRRAFEAPKVFIICRRSTGYKIEEETSEELRLKNIS